MNAKYLISKAAGYCKRYYTVAMTAGVVVGVPLTAYLAVKANEKYKEDKKKSDFALAGAVGAATIVLAIGTEATHLKREAALSLAYNALAYNFTTYKEHAASFLGGAGVAKVLEKQAEKADEIDILRDTDGETLHWFYDTFTMTWFKDTWEHVLLCNLELQQQYNENGYGLCEYYYMNLDLPYYNGPSGLGFDCETLQCDYDVTFIPFNYPEIKSPDGEYGIAIEWPISPEIIEWLNE